MAGNNNVGFLMDMPGFASLRAPKDVYWYHNDFERYAAGDWTVTTVEAGAGDATEAIVADGSYGPGGVLLITNDAGADDNDQFQGPEILKLDKATYFRCRVRLDDTGLAEWAVGLSITDTTLKVAGDLTSSDFIGFVGGPTDAAADKVLFRACKNSTETDSDQVTIVDATWMELEFFTDGDGNAWAWKDGVLIAEVTTNVPNDEYLAVSFVVNNSSAVIRIMAIDSIDIVSQR